MHARRIARLPRRVDHGHPLAGRRLDRCEHLDHGVRGGTRDVQRLVVGSRSACNASTTPRTASPTKVKARRWLPSPRRVNCQLPSVASIARATAMSGRLRGPFSVKKRSTTTPRSCDDA